VERRLGSDEKSKNTVESRQDKAMNPEGPEAFTAIQKLMKAAIQPPVSLSRILLPILAFGL
jgi:hypothetical protein